MADKVGTLALATQSTELVLPDTLRGGLAKFKETTKVSDIGNFVIENFGTIKDYNMLEHFGININENELKLTNFPEELGSLTVENVVNQMKSGMELALIFFLPKDILNEVYSMSQEKRAENLTKALSKKPYLNGGGEIDKIKTTVTSTINFFKHGYNVAASIGATALFLTTNPYDKYIKSMKNIFGEDILGLKGLIGNMPAYVGMSFLMCGMIVKKIIDCYKSIKERNTSEVCQCALTLVSELLGAYGVSNLPEDFLQNPPSQNVVIGIIALTLIQAAAEQGCSKPARVENGEGGAMKRKKSKRDSKRSIRSSKRSRRKSRK